MKTAHRFFIILLLSSLSACASVSTQTTPEPIVFDEATPVHAVILPPTWTPSGSEPDQKDLADTTTDSPRQATTPTAEQPAVALNEQGPWVLICTQGRASGFMDVYGDGFQPYEGSCGPVISPPGDIVVSMDFDRLEFTALPSMQRLLTYEYTEGSAASRMIGILTLWSPNGAYFAFLESIGGSVETEVLRAHLYMRASNVVETLETDFLLDDIVGWSPDSRYLLLRGMKVGEGEAIWAFDVAAGTFHQVDSSLRDVGQYAIGEIIGWTSDTTFIDWQNFRREAQSRNICDRYIRAVDIHSGVRKILAGPGAIMPAAFDPASGTVFFGVVPTECDSRLEPGLHRYNLDRGQVELLEAWIYLFDLIPEWPIDWSPEFGQFIVETLYPGRTMGFFKPSGELSFILEDAFSVVPSPDGNWIFVQSGEGDNLIDASGNLVESFPSGDYATAVWLPDSSGILLEAASGVKLLLADEDWQGDFLPAVASIGSLVVPVQP